MLVFLAYNGVVGFNAYRSQQNNNATKAPWRLKFFRNALNTLSILHYVYFGWFVTFNFGDWAIIDFFIGGNQRAIMQSIPILFTVSFISLELVKTSYLLWKTWSINSNVFLKTKDITILLLNLGIMFIMTLSATSVISPLLFPSLMLGYMAFNIWSNVSSGIYNAYEKNKLKKIIDWQLLLAQVYLNSTTALLLTLMAFQVFTLGGVLFNSIDCFKAAVYLFIKSTIDLYYKPEFTQHVLLQLGVASVQTLIGILLISGVIVIPETVIVSMIVLTIIKSLAFIPAFGAISKEVLQEKKVEKYYSALRRLRVVPKNTSSIDYLDECYQDRISAKSVVLPSSNPNSFYYRPDRSTTHPPVDDECLENQAFILGCL